MDGVDAPYPAGMARSADRGLRSRRLATPAAGGIERDRRRRADRGWSWGEVTAAGPALIPANCFL